MQVCITLRLAQSLCSALLQFSLRAINIIIFWVVTFDFVFFDQIKVTMLSAIFELHFIVSESKKKFRPLNCSQYCKTIITNKSVGKLAIESVAIVEMTKYVVNAVDE